VVDHTTVLFVVGRAGREQMQTRTRAGFLGPHSAKVLAEHGLGARMLHKGRRHIRGEPGDSDVPAGQDS
jgi:p-hydroxybenzoate 3-monooxygenase